MDKENLVPQSRPNKTMQDVIKMASQPVRITPETDEDSPADERRDAAGKD